MSSLISGTLKICGIIVLTIESLVNRQQVEPMFVQKVRAQAITCMAVCVGDFGIVEPFLNVDHA